MGLSGGLFWGLFGGLGALGGLKLPHEQSRGAMTGSWGPLEGLRGLKQESWEGQKSSGESARAILDPPIESVLAQKGPQRAFQEGSKRGRNRRVTEKEREAKNTVKHNGFEHFLASEGAQDGLENDSKSPPTRGCDGRRPEIGAKTAPRGPSERKLKVGRPPKRSRREARGVSGPSGESTRDFD